MCVAVGKIAVVLKDVSDVWRMFTCFLEVEFTIAVMVENSSG